MRVVGYSKNGEKAEDFFFLTQRKASEKQSFLRRVKKRAMYLSEIHLSFFLFSLLLFVKLKTLFHKERSAL
ncbi:MAG: hypothetical protein PHO32_09010 [Candidatus Cloacimonetes bacterium]|nr:hypothetical protein [Candidatus Cloacimonadota bacterium]